MAKRAIYASALEHVARTEGLLSGLREAETTRTEAQETISSLILNGFDGESEEEPTKVEQVAADTAVQQSSLPPPLLGDQVIVVALAGEVESPVVVVDVEGVDFEADGQGQLQGFSKQACTPRRTLSMHTPQGCKMPLLRLEGSFSLTRDTLGRCFIHSEFYMVLSALRSTCRRQV